ncbi:MAG: M48 family metallopeptidase [Candidatus Omnitrophica bacterium]|nr:M48 family metallopeptidase [Candidatus Omnitrophota bacterium]
MVDTDSSIAITVPAPLNDEVIKKVIRKKARWILGKQRYFFEIRARFPIKEFVSGEEILFLGKRFRLKVAANGSNPEIRREGRKLYVGLNHTTCLNQKKDEVKGLLTDWYQSQADEIIRTRVSRFSSKVGVHPKVIKVKNQEKRWGSCSKSGVLRFNWKIIMAPVSIVDYVSVHELCHLKFQNHSPAFWKLVSSVLPDYQERREWLRKNAPTLSI